MKMKKRFQRLFHILLFALFLGVFSTSVAALDDPRPICTGMACLTNTDCGVGCICANGMCYSVNLEEGEEESEK